MRVRAEQSWIAFLGLTEQSWFSGTRIKQVRNQRLQPGGRVELSLFSKVSNQGRPHPRLITNMPPVNDPKAGFDWLGNVDKTLNTALEFKAWLEAVCKKTLLKINKIEQTPSQSPRYVANSIRSQRIECFFEQVKVLLESQFAQQMSLASEVQRARYYLMRRRAEAFAAEIEFDDVDTRTYHSFGSDQPFVHYMEKLLDSLPDEPSQAMAVLDGTQQESIRRQRNQLQNHLDHIMRHKYANKGIAERDIERTLGGFLIDKHTRKLVSQTIASQQSLVPSYELLRIKPNAARDSAGEYVYRDGQGSLRLQDGTRLQLKESDLRNIPLDPAQLTFLRAPDHHNLRPGVQFDWDNNGYVQKEPIDWISWAGHCDIKAIMEQLGLGYQNEKDLVEYRSDTDQQQVYNRDLQLEMMASALELGSVYERVDGSGSLVRGIHRFGGARNDSRPDRLQLQGLGPGQSFRWPLSGRFETFSVTKIETKGVALEPNQAFQRYLADSDGLGFRDNDRFIKTVDGDCNLIDASDSLVTVSLQETVFDPDSGYPIQQQTESVLDLRNQPKQKRSYLGTHLHNAHRREVYHVYLDHERRCIWAQLVRWERNELSHRFESQTLSDQGVEIPLREPLGATLSREMHFDDPALFQSLLSQAVQKGQNICADTDMRAQVWNGVVTKLSLKKIAEDETARIEHWRCSLKARFGSSEFVYLVKFDEQGHAQQYHPLPTRDSVDFLWQEFPDIASKGVEDGDWVVNQTMLERGLVELRVESQVPGGVYIYDDHIKNLFELIYCSLSGTHFTIVHQNKRYGYQDEAAWKADVEKMKSARKKLTIIDETGG